MVLASRVYSRMDFLRTRESAFADLKHLLEEDPMWRLFKEYKHTFFARDVEKSAEHFADVFISADPKGAIARSRDEHLQMA